ncbi:cell wall-binding repeat-containing protein [Clostridium sp. cel8]|uniref:cell wall-binding repeat-containing protein n=1 Tax=Clostridium sp. cel8 TaxID=2663123 RepID=UPI0015F5E8E8|nr:cell wall-binding repeat-containing protein [Clostridium sp. cel8]MBA5850042.1 cell wall-binding repeat-containing protein [Clostridium sp. cel8]
MQKNNKKFLSACGIATLVVSTAVVPTTGVKAASTERLAGSDRYETAVEVSEEGWTSSDYVVLANGESYADALCAVPLAKAKDAPILLTETNSLNSETLAEMKRLNAKHVIIVGGDGVVTEGVQNAIKSQVTSDVERYGGADRFETSVKIAKALGSPSEVFVANGLNFPDALSAAPIAAIEGDPIILTRSTELPQVSADYIESNSNITKSYVVGGSGVISDSILNKLPNPERLGGADRYETNEAIVEAFESSLNFNKVFVARGDEFSDSLTGAALAAKEKSALVITATSGSVSPYTKELFEDLVDSGVTIEALGGSAVLPDSIISDLESAITKSSTSGGGGSSSSSSSSSSTSGENLMNEFRAGGLLNSIYEDYLTRVNDTSGDLYNSFFGIDLGGKYNDDSNAINIDLKDQGSKVTTIAGIFSNAKSRYGLTNSGSTDKETLSDKGEAKLKSDVKRINNKLDNSFKNLKINGMSVKTFLGSLGSQYFYQSGTLKGNLNPEAIKTLIEDKDIADGYNTFKTELKGQIDAYFEHNTEGKDIADDPAKLTYTIYYGDNDESKLTLEIASVTGESLNIKSGEKVENAVNDIYDFIFPDNSDNSTTNFTGRYKVTLSNGDYVYINVNKAN